MIGETFVSVTEMCPVCITGSRTHAIQLKTLASCSRGQAGGTGKVGPGGRRWKTKTYICLYSIFIYLEQEGGT